MAGPDLDLDATVLLAVGDLGGGDDQRTQTVLQWVLHVRPPDVVSRASVEASIHRLRLLGLLSGPGGAWRLTDAGAQLHRPTRRLEHSRRVRRVAGKLAEYVPPPASEIRRWRLPPTWWSEALEEVRDWHRRRLRDRLEILDGLIRAIDGIDEIIELARSSADVAAARHALTRPPFDFTSVQANHVLDLAVNRQTRAARRSLAEERDTLRIELAALAPPRTGPTV